MRGCHNLLVRHWEQTWSYHSSLPVSERPRGFLWTENLALDMLFTDGHTYTCQNNVPSWQSQHDAARHRSSVGLRGRSHPRSQGFFQHLWCGAWGKWSIGQQAAPREGLQCDAISSRWAQKSRNVVKRWVSLCNDPVTMQVLSSTWFPSTSVNLIAQGMLHRR